MSSSKLFRSWTKFPVLEVTFSVVTVIMLAFTMTATGKREKPRETYRVVRTNKLINCPDKPIHPFHFTRTRPYSPAKNVYAFEADGFNERPTKTIEQISVNVSKCPNSTMRGCQYMRKLEWKGSNTICPLMKADGAPWSPVLKGFSPPLACANKKGNFTVRNMSLNFKEIAQMYFGGQEYWVISFSLYDQNHRPWSCFYSESDFPLVHGRAKRFAAQRNAERFPNYSV